jgi:hypothetical protein
LHRPQRRTADRAPEQREPHLSAVDILVRLEEQAPERFGASRRNRPNTRASYSPPAPATAAKSVSASPEFGWIPDDLCATIARPRRVERLEDKGTPCPVRDLLAGRGVEAEDKLQAVGTHAQWLHATDGSTSPRMTILRLSSRLSWFGVIICGRRGLVAASLSRLKSKAGPAERHPGALWKPQRFVQVRIVKNVPEVIDDLAISPKLIRKHKLDRSQHECEKCVVAVQQRGFCRRRTDEIA